MNQVRQPAVAGRFYPADPALLRQDVDSLLSAAGSQAPAAPPKVLVAPHAGYIYSGPLAACAYRQLDGQSDNIRRVILLGPSHRVGFRGIASTSASHYRTPLGDIPLDTEGLERIRALPGVHERDAAHGPEHSLEVHLPFLQRCLSSFRLLPLVVGDASPEQVGAVIEALWGGPETLLVISSDLSHFLDYDQARSRDSNTAQRIEAMVTDLKGEEACGARPLNGLLGVLKQRGLAIRRIGMNNSGDTAGDRTRVVGYGAWVVDAETAKCTDQQHADQDRLGLAARQQLLHLARSAISHGLHGKGNLDIPLEHYDAELRQPRASFVTLNLRGALRGCIGSLTATRPLLADVVHNAGAAAFRDRRFKPLTASEYPAIDLHISVLSPPRAIDVESRQALLDVLRPGVHGLVLQEGNKRSTYLPSVWEKIPDPERFVSELRAKAGLPRQGWSSAMQVSLYTTDEFS